MDIKTMKLTFKIFLSTLWISFSCIAQVIKVPQDKATIQEALNFCKRGDTVLVSPGTYYENLFWPKTFSICLISEQGPDSTVIDGGGKNTVITIDVDVDSLSAVNGFTIKNGKARIGAGVYCSSSQFRILHNKFEGNKAVIAGGGIACVYGSNATIKYNSFFDNSTEYTEEQGGGGIYCNESSPWIGENKFFNNRAFVGAGVHCRRYSSPTIINNEFNNNEVYNSCAAICCNLGSNPIIKNNLIRNNHGPFGGGGIGCYNESSPLIENNEITYNTTDLFGGGIDIWQNSSPIVRNNIIKFNSSYQGGGIRIHRDCNPEIIDCIISNNVSSNDGGGVYIREMCFPIFKNCAITDNKAGQNGGGLFSDDSDPTFENLVVRNNYTSQSGGGLYFLFGDIVFNKISVLKNRAVRGGGIFFDNIRTVQFDNRHLSSVYLNIAEFQGDEFYANTDRTLDIRLDTFTVKYPNVVHIFPLKMLDLSFKNYKVNQDCADIFVSVNGDDTNSGFSRSNPLRSLNLALAKMLLDSLHSHTIYLMEGKYKFHYLPENLTLSTGFQSEIVYRGNEIIVVSPMWKSWWALFVYLCLFMGLIYTIWKIQTIRIKKKHKYEMSRFEARKLQEIDEMKTRFFANISHEFRTPLTLIIGPARQLIDKINDEKVKNELNIIQKSANRLKQLVNQLLDLSKLEAGSMKLKTQEENISEVLQAFVLSFASYAERKNIILKFHPIENDVKIFIDMDKFEKIINNILSNAFKFTADGGKIDVILNRIEDNIEIKISDTGMGIPQDRINKIFDRFYQVDNIHTRKSEGTGIGLSLTKELIELHKGKIKIDSLEGKGTTVKIIFPTGSDHLTPDEIIEKKVFVEKEHITSHITEMPEDKGKIIKPDIETMIETEKPLLLVVEDNLDVRNYIKSNLERENRILEAVNGKDGIDKAIEYIPDLIISDIMMPEVDGYELCQTVKKDERTSHIPVILLTAKASGADKIEGLEIGADDYIMKPFDVVLLEVRIKNLIEQRKKLRKRFTKDATVPINRGKYTQVDEKFLRNMMDIIHKHIAEPEYSLEEFGKEIGMSRMQLHRKIKALTDYSPHQFIRFIRLKKAAELLNKGTGNVTEIAYDVGFNSLSHFAKTFREQFGKSPSDYMSDKKEK
jgi:signal transduction histidine kinase/DNA-binding response OmpR family regulator